MSSESIDQLVDNFYRGRVVSSELKESVWDEIDVGNYDDLFVVIPNPKNAELVEFLGELMVDELNERNWKEYEKVPSGDRLGWLLAKSKCEVEDLRKKYFENLSEDDSYGDRIFSFELTASSGKGVWIAGYWHYGADEEEGILGIYRSQSDLLAYYETEGKVIR